MFIFKDKNKVKYILRYRDGWNIIRKMQIR